MEFDLGFKTGFVRMAKRLQRHKNRKISDSALRLMANLARCGVSFREHKNPFEPNTDDWDTWNRVCRNGEKYAQELIG